MDAFQAHIGSWSRDLFRRQHRLDVLCAIALHPLGVVFAREIARQLEVGDNQVAPDLAMLRGLGALQFAPGPSREQHHVRVPHPIWQLALRLLVLAAQGRTPSGQAAPLLDDYVRERYGHEQRPPVLTATIAGLEAGGRGRSRE